MSPPDHLDDFVPIKEAIRILNLESLPHARRLLKSGRLRGRDWWGETVIELASVREYQKQTKAAGIPSGFVVEGRQVCTTAEAARLYGCTTGRIRQLARAGKLWNRHLSPRMLVFDVEEVRRQSVVPQSGGGPRRGSPALGWSEGVPGFPTRRRRPRIDGRLVCVSKEAVEILGVSRQRLSQLAKAGQIWTSTDDYGRRIFDVEELRKRQRKPHPRTARRSSSKSSRR